MEKIKKIPKNLPTRKPKNPRLKELQKEIKTRINLMQASANLTNTEVAASLNISPATYTQYLDSSFSPLIRFIQIANACDCTVIIDCGNDLKMNLSDMVRHFEE